MLLSGFFQIHASETTDQNWKEQLKLQKLASEDQSYCYTDERGKVEGVNVDMRIRLASVSKLLTSLWAIERLSLDFKYDTKLFIKGNNLHIQGSFDPFVGNEKMFFLLSELNNIGYKKFDTITFDRNLLVNPYVQYAAYYPVVNAETNIVNLKNYFNTKLWSAETKAEYLYFYNNDQDGRFKKEVEFEVSNVKYVDENPFPNDDTVKVYTLSSPSLYKYLKEMNVKSHNYVAEVIFAQLGGAPKFEEYLKGRFNLSADKIHFFSGSGLPFIESGIRKDNYATCSVMLDLIAELKNAIERQHKEIEDLVAVPGSDQGTFRNRVFPEDYKNTFVAKTGTLVHTSTLAGALNTKKGFSFFGIFNQSTDIVGSKIVQNFMVESIMTEMGGPSAFNYVVEKFRTYNIKMDIKSDFSSIEEGLF